MQRCKQYSYTGKLCETPGFGWGVPGLPPLGHAAVLIGERHSAVPAAFSATDAGIPGRLRRRPQLPRAAIGLRGHPAAAAEARMHRRDTPRRSGHAAATRDALT